MQIILEDQVIKNRLFDILQLSSFERRSVLNNLLEELRLRKAPQNLLNVLSRLFDDKTAEDLLALLKPQLNDDLLTNLGGKS